MDDRFFEQPILNSPYEYPAQHWELDSNGQPTNQIVERRREVTLITPIPKPKKQKTGASQPQMVFDEKAKKVSTEAQQYDPTPIINSLRRKVDLWRALPDPAAWRVQFVSRLGPWVRNREPQTRRIPLGLGGR